MTTADGKVVEHWNDAEKIDGVSYYHTNPIEHEIEGRIREIVAYWSVVDQYNNEHMCKDFSIMAIKVITDDVNFSTFTGFNEYNFVYPADD